MKKLIVLILILNMTFTNAQSQFSTSRNLVLKNSNETKSYDIEVNAQTKELVFQISCSIKSGDLKVELFNPHDERVGVYNLRAENNDTIYEIGNIQTNPVLPGVQVYPNLKSYYDDGLYIPNARPHGRGDRGYMPNAYEPDHLHLVSPELRIAGLSGNSESLVDAKRILEESVKSFSSKGKKCIDSLQKANLVDKQKYKELQKQLDELDKKLIDLEMAFTEDVRMNHIGDLKLLMNSITKEMNTLDLYKTAKELKQLQDQLKIINHYQLQNHPYSVGKGIQYGSTDVARVFSFPSNEEVKGRLDKKIVDPIAGNWRINVVTSNNVNGRIKMDIQQMEM